MQALYQVIDKGASTRSSISDLSADAARKMTVEFISKDSGRYGQALNALVAEIHREVTN
jgi:hypothetical protein